jgi:hypothetical protein
LELVSIDVLLLFFQVINDVLKIIFRGNHFRFGSVFIKKIKIKLVFYKKKLKPNQKQFKLTGFGSVILEQKPVQTGLVRFFPV